MNKPVSRLWLLASLVLLAAAADLASFSFAHNYWYNCRHPGKSIPRLTARQKDAAGGKDPRLDRDFRPAADSPARDYGAFAPGMEKAWLAQTSRFSWAWQQAQRLLR
jgi:hypothetical protein